MKVWLSSALLFLICLSGFLFVRPLHAGQTSNECECRIEPGSEYGTFKSMYVQGIPITYCFGRLCYVTL